MPVLSPNLNVMIAAAKKAGRGMARDFGEVEKLQVSKKGTADFVSSADMQAEKTLVRELSKARPTYGFLTEESTEVVGEDTERRWIIDPLDGTKNFLHGIPHFGISIALEEKGEITTGVVYNPISDELFYAEKGFGAYLATARGDSRLRVSGRSKINEALIACGSPYCDCGADYDKYLLQVKNVITKTSGLRDFGAGALDLCFVAAGRIEAFWELGLKAWDMAAGIIIVKEAGGAVCQVGVESDIRVDNSKAAFTSGNILACNRNLHKEIMQMLNV